MFVDREKILNVSQDISDDVNAIKHFLERCPFFYNIVIYLCSGAVLRYTSIILEWHLVKNA